MTRLLLILLLATACCGCTHRKRLADYSQLLVIEGTDSTTAYIPVPLAKRHYVRLVIR